MDSKWVKEKNNLEAMILNLKLSYEEIGRKYNCTGSNIKKVAKKLGICLSKRRLVNDFETFNHRISKKEICLNCGNEFKKQYKNNIFCCFNCSAEYKHKQSYKLFLKGDINIMRATYDPGAYKKDIINELNGKCAICGCEQEHNGKPLVFVLDHIDGHAANNKRENLRCICPNCDSQLDTYKSKNKKSDREYYHFHHR